MEEQPAYEGILLGRDTPVRNDYSPELLYPIPRSGARQQLQLPPRMRGVDVWHAYELSWLDAQGKPLSRVGRFGVPSDSPNMVESKSFKLYLHSLNSASFKNEADAVATICADISRVAGAEVTLELLAVDDPSLAGTTLHGVNLDELPLVPSADDSPTVSLLQAGPAGDSVEETLYSHLLRSLCPVTGQPDWATLWLHYRGRPLDHASVLRYIVSFRNHQEFHEQCVERMFSDIHQYCEPEVLHIQGFYTRRGGLDINPFRSTDSSATPLARLNRQ